MHWVSSPRGLLMHRMYRCAGLFILAMALAVPTSTTAQEQKDTKKSEGETTEKAKSKKDKAKAPDWRTTVDGKITALEDKDDNPLTFTVQVTTKVPERNTSAEQQLVQHQQQLLQHQQSLAKAK